MKRILAVVAVVCLLVSACGNDDSSKNVSAATEAPATAAPEPTEAPEPTSTDFDIDSNTTWQEVFDTFTTSEQDCIRSEVDEGHFESAMKQTILEEAIREEWNAHVYQCLALETARGLILSMTLASFETEAIQNELGPDLEYELADDEKLCLQHWARDIDPVAIAADEDDPAFVEAGFGRLACVPGLLIAVAAQELGVVPGELADDEKLCLQHWARNIDPAALAADEDAAAVEVSLGMLACVPDLLIATVAQDLGVSPEELGDDEKLCLQDWARNIDPADLAADEDDEAAIEVGLGMLACVPGFGQEFGDLSDTSADDHADISEDATVVAVDAATEGVIENLSDVDFFAFQAEAGVTYQMDVAPVTMSDPHMALYDTFGELDYSDDYEDLAPRIYWEAPSSGTYYVAVEGYDLGTYVLTIAAQ